MTKDQADRIIKLLAEVAEEVRAIQKEDTPADYNDDIWRGVMDGLTEGKR